MRSFIESWSDFVLNETLRTNDIDLTFRNVKSELSLLRYNFKIDKIDGTILITLLNFRCLRDIGLHIDVLNRMIIDRHGWFPSKMDIKNFSGLSNEFPYDLDHLLDNRRNIYYEEVSITYEAKYDIEFSVPGKLYHLSIIEFESDIIKRGLIPKSKSKLSKHLDRIYVCDNIEACYRLISRMKLIYGSSKYSRLNTNWILYEIDSSNLDIKLYKDPNYIGGFYVVDNIHPNLIKVIERE